MNRVVDRCSIASRLGQVFSLDAHVKVSVYRESLFFFFFFPSDDAVPILDLVSPGASPKPSFVPTPIRAFSGRGKFRPTSSQPLYSTVFAACIRENSAADRRRHKVFWWISSGSRIPCKWESISCESSGNDVKIYKPLFHLTFQRIWLYRYIGIGNDL